MSTIKSIESLELSRMKMAVIEKILTMANTVASDATMKDIAVKLGAMK